MKTTYSFLLLALLGNGLLAQPSLEFSQVRLITAEETVPTGKVWKVEAALGPATSVQQNSSTLSTTPSLPSSHIILVNGSTVSVLAHGFLGNSVSAGGSTTTSNYRLVTVGKEFCTSFPFWLPEGATLEAGSNVNSISVIEFTITN